MFYFYYVDALVKMCAVHVLLSAHFLSESRVRSATMSFLPKSEMQPKRIFSFPGHMEAEHYQTLCLVQLSMCLKGMLQHPVCLKFRGLHHQK